MLLPSLSMAENPISESSIKPVRFATSIINPWGIIKEGQPPDGLLVRLQNRLEEKTGIPIENQMLPYTRVIHSLFSGLVDMAVIFDSKQASRNAIRIAHVVNARVLVFGAKDSVPLTSIDALEGLSIGFMRGSRYADAFDTSPLFKRVPVNTMRQGLAMLVNNRIDAMAGTDHAFYWTMNEMGISPTEINQWFEISGATGSLYISKLSDREDLVHIFKEVLEDMQRTGELENIFMEDYFWSDNKTIGELYKEHKASSKNKE